MRAFPMQRDPNAVPGRKHRPCLRANTARRECEHVLGERDVGLGNPIAQPIVHHRLGTARNFLGRLKQRDERAAPGAARLRQEFRGAEQTRHMRVMTTRVTHINSAASVRRCGRRSVWQACGFFHWKRVHICPREHRAAFSTPQNAEDTCPADPFDDLVSEFLELGRDQACGSRFLKTELGMSMDVLVKILLPLSRCLKTPQDVGQCSHQRPPLPESIAMIATVSRFRRTAKQEDDPLDILLRSDGNPPLPYSVRSMAGRHFRSRLTFQSASCSSHVVADERRVSPYSNHDGTGAGVGTDVCAHDTRRRVDLRFVQALVDQKLTDNRIEFVPVLSQQRRASGVTPSVMRLISSSTASRRPSDTPAMRGSPSGGNTESVPMCSDIPQRPTIDPAIRVSDLEIVSHPRS